MNLFKKGFLTIFFFMLSGLIYGQINLDSIRLVISKKKAAFSNNSTQKKLELAEELAYLYLNTDIDTTGFIEWAEQYHQLCEEQNDYPLERTGYFKFLLSYCYYNDELYAYRLNKAKELVKLEADSVLHLTVLLAEAQYAAFIEGNFKEGLSQYLQAELLNNSLGKNIMTATLYFHLSTAYQRMEKFTQAIAYADKLLQLNDITLLAKARGHFAKGMTLVDIQQLDSVAYHLNTAARYYSQLSNTYFLVLIYNRLGMYYADQNQLSKALAYFLKIEPILKKVSYSFGTRLPEIYFNIGNLYQRKNQLSLARSYYEKSIKQAESEIHRDPLITYRNYKSYEALGNLEEKSQRYEKALEHFKLAKSYSDSLAKFTRNKTIEELSIKYETREKEQQIALLDSENRVLAIRNQNYLLIVGGAMLAAFLTLGFYLNIKRKKQQIQRQKEALSEALDTKDRLFAIIGHDLRKPALAFRGISEKVNFLIQQKEFETLNQLGGSLEKAAFSLNSLLDNLLNWALQQREVLPYHPVSISIKEATEDIYQIFGQISNEKGVTLKFDIQESTNVFSDPNAFATIVRNLVDNAIKYTPTGGMVVLRAEKQTPNIRLQVSDSGVGMTESQIANIFKLGRNESTKGTEGETGTGLGLTLVKDLVALNLGSIKIISVYQKGTTFEVLLPAA